MCSSSLPRPHWTPRIYGPYGDNRTNRCDRTHWIAGHCCEHWTDGHDRSHWSHGTEFYRPHGNNGAHGYDRTDRTHRSDGTPRSRCQCDRYRTHWAHRFNWTDRIHCDRIHRPNRHNGSDGTHWTYWTDWIHRTNRCNRPNRCCSDRSHWNNGADGWNR